MLVNALIFSDKNLEYFLMSLIKTIKLIELLNQKNRKLIQINFFYFLLK